MKSCQGLVKYALVVGFVPGPLRFTLRKNVSVTMKFEVLQQERLTRRSSRKSQGPMAEEDCYNIFLIEIFMGEENTKTRERPNLELFQTDILGHVLIKPAHSFLGAWSLLLVHIWFTHSEAPEGFVNCFLLRNWTMEVEP